MREDDNDLRPIESLKQKFSTQIEFIEDPELEQDVQDWLEEVGQLPDADVMNHVEDTLSSIRRDDSGDTVRQFPMRRVGTDGEADFPDSCEGCPHYGVRCPVFVDPVEVDRRRRIQDEFEGESSTAIRQAYRRYAEQNQCHQITDALTAWSTDYQDLVKRGWELFERVETMRRTDSDDVRDIMDDVRRGD